MPTMSSFAGATLKVVGAPLTSGQSAAGRDPPARYRAVDAGAGFARERRSRRVVTRQVYLGAARDYMVEVADGTSLRATTPTETSVPKGGEVWLTLPPERCRALSR